MDLEKQVCSLGLAKQLKELGVVQDSYWYWRYRDAAWHLERIDITVIPEADYVSAFTVAELGELLSDFSYTWRCLVGDVMYWRGGDDVGDPAIVSAYSEADVKANLLIWQIKHGIDKRGMVDPFLVPDDFVGSECEPDDAAETDLPQDELCDDCGICGPDGVDKEISGEVGCVRHDDVNHPDHYTSGGIEVIDFIEAKGLGFHLGNAVKYIARAGKKDPDNLVQDLEKARWYIDRAIENDGDSQ